MDLRVPLKGATLVVQNFAVVVHLVSEEDVLGTALVSPEDLFVVVLVVLEEILLEGVDLEYHF